MGFQIVLLILIGSKIIICPPELQKIEQLPQFINPEKSWVGALYISDFTKQTKNLFLVKNCLEAVRIISLSKNYHLAKTHTSVTMPKIQGPRNSYAGVLICVGGRGNEGDPYKSVEYLEAGENREWKPLPNMINARRHVGAIALCGSLYAVGGHSGSEHLSSVECFDLHSKRWRLKLEFKNMENITLKYYGEIFQKI